MFTVHGTGVTRIQSLIEASAESKRVARCLEPLGHEVNVADPNYVPMVATRTAGSRATGTTPRALMDARRLGAYRPAQRTSEAQRGVRAQLAMRNALVRTRARFISLIRARMRREGLRVRTGTDLAFPQRLVALTLPERRDRRAQP